MGQRKWLSSKVWFGTPFMLLILVAVACGSAAPEPTAVPELTATQGADDGPTAEPTAVPVESDTPQPTPTPQMAAPPADIDVHPGKLTWMIGSFGNERFDNLFTIGQGHDYLRQLNAFLISSDVKDGRRVYSPGIATKWEISGDGLTWTFTIRKGAKFHDGTEVTPEDVSWSLQHTIGPGTLELRPITLARIIDQIEQTGPDRVSVTTKIPAMEVADQVSDATGVYPGIVLPKRETLYDEQEAAAYDLNPIGAGIMRLVKHVPVEVMSFERFDDYYHQPANGFSNDKRVNFKLLDLRLVPEEATRVAALRAGEADIAPVTLGARQQVETGGGRLVFGQEGTGFHILPLGCWKPQFPCHDQRVRQALNYAIDKELLRDRLYGPEVMQVKGLGAFLSPSTIGYSPGLDPYPFDPDKARQLLAEAGYPGGEGFGKLVINVWVATSTPLLPESAQLGAEFWKRELGLDVEVRVGERAALQTAYSVTEDLHGQILWRDNEARIDAMGILRIAFGNPDRPGRLHNDPELFAMVDKMLTIIDPVEREKAQISINWRLRDEAYMIYLGYMNIPWGVAPRVQTWEPYPLAFYPSALHTITLK